MPRLGEAIFRDAFRATSVLTPDAWALYDGGGMVFCRGFAGGIDLGIARAEVEIPLEGAQVLLPTIIPADPLALYADDSFAFLLGTSAVNSQSIATWNAGGDGSLAVQTIAAGRALTTPLFSDDGWLYFLDYDKASSLNEDNDVRIVVRLFRSRIDLAEVEGVWQFDLIRPPTFTAKIACPRLSQSFLHLTVDLFHEETAGERFDLVMPLAGGEPVELTGLAGLRPLSGYGLSRGFDETLFWVGPQGGSYDTEPYLWFQGDDDTSEPEPRWLDPTESSAWLTGWTEMRSLGLNFAKTRALAFGMNTAEVVASVTLANAGDAGGLSRYPVEESAELGFPIAYFLKS